MSDDSPDISARLMKLVSAAAAHGLSVVEDGDNLLPTFFQERGGKIDVHLLGGAVTAEEYEDMKNRVLASLDPDVDAYVYIVDGYVRCVDGDRIDAIIVEVAERDAPDAFLFAQPYRPASDEQGFARLSEPMFGGCQPSEGWKGAPPLGSIQVRGRGRGVRHWFHKLREKLSLRRVGPVPSDDDGPSVIGMDSPRSLEPTTSPAESHDEFADLLMRALRKEGVEEAVEYDADDFRLIIRGSDDDRSAQTSLSLENQFRQYSDVAKYLRAEFINHVVQVTIGALVGVPKDLADAVKNILPHVRSRFYFTKLNMKLSSPLPFQELGDHLGVGIIYDTEHSMALVTNEHLKHWGIDFEEGLAIARAVLSEISKEAFREIAPGVYSSPWQDNRDASRVVLTDTIRKLAVNGDHVAMIADRDTVLVTGSMNVAGCRSVAELAAAKADGPGAICGIPLLLTADGWQAWEPDGAEFRELHNLRADWLAATYNEQQEILNEHEERSDAFLATVMLRDDEATGKRAMLATWSPYKETGLPRVDEICLELGGSLCVIPFDHLFRALPDLFTPMGLYPERYRLPQPNSVPQLTEWIDNA